MIAVLTPSARAQAKTGKLSYGSKCRKNGIADQARHVAEPGLGGTYQSVHARSDTPAW